jgi:hypothetical protein
VHENQSLMFQAVLHVSQHSKLALKLPLSTDVTAHYCDRTVWEGHEI